MIKKYNYKAQHDGKEFNWKSKITFNDKFITKKQKEIIMRG
jgi:hypothetical protein